MAGAAAGRRLRLSRVWDRQSIPFSTDYGFCGKWRLSGFFFSGRDIMVNSAVQSPFEMPLGSNICLKPQLAGTCESRSRLVNF